jgi:prepilin-type N-terminal cleavage/methylation domain-containing protein
MSKKGFTLIELLVVIAVIALLMGILMPALNIARDQGRKASCMSNMRQVGIALAMYQNEYEKTPPKTHAVYDYATPAAPDNVLKLLRPFLYAKKPEDTTPVYACPALKPKSESELCSFKSQQHRIPRKLCRHGPIRSGDSQPRQNYRYTGRMVSVQSSLGTT